MIDFDQNENMFYIILNVYNNIKPKDENMSLDLGKVWIHDSK